MFKRIKNLLDISRYTVEELKQPNYEYTTSGYMHVEPNNLKIISSTPTMPFRAATIVNMKENDPFNHITNETPEQPFEDPTIGK